MGEAPFFIVGAPRSGTTMLAALLDRHSRLSVPPETQFFTEFIPRYFPGGLPDEREQIVAKISEFERLADLGLSSEELLNALPEKGLTPERLLEIILELYAQPRGSARVGEKSPNHFWHVERLLAGFERSKVICLMRDGRDVVGSMLKVPWNLPGNPRRFGLFCEEWNEFSRKAEEYLRTLPEDRFMVVRYEELVTDTSTMLGKVCSFLGEEPETSQLAPSTDHGVVPEWESDWKGKALEATDPKRAYAWKREADRGRLWAMNSAMGSALQRWGYPEVTMNGCPLWRRAYLKMAHMPYLKPVRPLSLLGLKLLRILGFNTGNKFAGGAA